MIRDQYLLSSTFIHSGCSAVSTEAVRLFGEETTGGCHQHTAVVWNQTCSLFLCSDLNVDVGCSLMCFPTTRKARLVIWKSHGLRFSLCAEQTFRKPFRPGGSELSGSVCLLLWQTVSILTVCPDGEVNLPHSVCFAPWRKPRWPTRPANNTHIHTDTADLLPQ